VPSPPADVIVDEATLRDHPLPDHRGDTNKDARGQVVVVAGSAETPGAALLAATAALRVGAGKLQIVTVSGNASALAVAVPEARVIGLPSQDGEIDASSLAGCARSLNEADAVLVGPGFLDPGPAAHIAAEVMRHLGPKTTLVVDAAALAVFHACADIVGPVAGRTIAMPNTIEAADLLGVDPDAVSADLAGSLDRLLEQLRTFVALRDATTYTGGPGLPRFIDHSGHPALGTSGSGDVLAGMIAGLAARGATPITAMVWGAYAHGRAGEQVAQRVGGIGLLAREVVDAVPPLLNALTHA
jgi:hydroxyethylthiazole kinase-like uncharacterized protein yjeF